MGKVEQGRVIAFDKDKGTVTFIREVKGDAANPDYSGAPLTFALPKELSERGADPKVGLRMKLDTKAKEIVIFDAATQGFKEDRLYPNRPEGKRGQGRPPGGRKEIPSGGQGQKGHNHLFREAKDPDHLLGAR